MNNMTWREKRRWRREFEDGLNRGLTTEQACLRADNVIRTYRARKVRP